MRYACASSVPLPGKTSSSGCCSDLNVSSKGRGSRSKRAKNAKVILGWRRKGILRVISPKCGGKWRPYPSPITDEENARFVRQLTQDRYLQSVVGLWQIWFRYSGN